MFKGEAAKTYSNIMLGRKYPALMDYNVLMSQPNFWLESIQNLEEAERIFNKNQPSE